MNVLIYLSDALQNDQCNQIIDIFEKAPFTEVVQEDHVAYSSDGNESIKYVDRQGRTCYNLSPSNPDTKKVMQIIEGNLPDGRDFQYISFMQIIKNSTGSYMPYHKDEADTKDTGTAIVYLNDDFTGGKFFLDGHVFTAHKGSVLAFNNSKERFHAVEPIYSGDRYVLALWFTDE